MVEGDLDSIYNFIADYAGEATADRIVGGIAGRAQHLSEMPHIGSRRDEVLPRLRIVTCERKAVIAFRVDDGRRRVEVLAVTYGGADWQARARARG